MIEEQRRLDQLQLHDPERSFVVRNHVDPSVSGGGRRAGERRVRELDSTRRRP
jgi:hypothetical protein